MTGAHAFKVGFNNLMGNNRNSNSTGDTATSYRFNNTIPNLITEYATPNSRRSHLTEGALFAQDKWTVKRLTINAGLRFDYFNTYFPEQFLGPGPLVPNRSITFAATDWYQFKDISPRGGVAYDLFGNGKTAVKVSIGKYCAGRGSDPRQPVLQPREHGDAIVGRSRAAAASTATTSRSATC